MPIRALVRNGAFEPIDDADVEVRISAPDGRMEGVKAGRREAVPTGSSRRRSGLRSPASIASPLTRGAAGAALGTATGALLVGGADFEMTDPRVNVPSCSGSRWRPAAARWWRRRCRGWPRPCAGGCPPRPWRRPTDLWNTGWSFGAIVLLLSAEWVLRRLWGLR